MPGLLQLEMEHLPEMEMKHRLNLLLLVEVPVPNTVFCHAEVVPSTTPQLRLRAEGEIGLLRA